MKSVLISIQPYWVFLIIAKAIGWNIGKEKTIEVRKTFPKDKNWNKIVKIYCSKNKNSFAKIPEQYQSLMEQFSGKVIGEFVCDKISTDRTFGHDVSFYSEACMGDIDIASYCVNSEMYGWHISDLVIYEQLKELSEFRKIGALSYDDWLYGIYNGHSESSYEKYILPFTVTRPPQSWYYVETDGGSDA